MDGSSPAPVAAPRRVLVGVHLSAACQAPADTLAALHEATAEPFDLVVLADPDPAEATALAAALARVAGVDVAQVPAPGGPAASFNALVSRPADVWVFLEGGTAPAPGWLTGLLRALDADPAHGLCGPATNRAWNAQALAGDCGPAPAELLRTAEALAQRHPEVWRPTSPLVDLADVCLAVRGEVVAAIGGADVAYGRGPCWEMDYAARAGRAGFRSVWAPAAFVRRGPATPGRRASEADLLAANKRLYQDRLCGRRLRATGRQGAYHHHCAGEACPDFAPAGAVRLRHPLPSPPPRPPRPDAPPLISCIMPTRGRARFVAQSIAYFRRQDYSNRELVIVYENDADLPAGIADDPAIRLVRTTQASIGGKREAGTLAARGEIIVHWDDDDWYGPERLSRQAAPILRGVAEITGLNDILFLAMARGEFWLAAPDLFRRMFVENVSGGTLMFSKAVWRRSGPYPPTSLREDADFMVKAMRDGARLCRLPGRELCIYVRHERNTWKFAEGRHLRPADWLRAEAPAFWRPDRGFYLEAAPAAGLSAAPRPPLVSCIMPTADRRLFVPQAIRAFLSQDYAERELLVVDDGQDSVADLIPDDPRIRYLRLERRLSLGAKRNLACELARGELIAHWDDDDWMAPGWLTAQVRTLLEAGADLCGLDTVFFYAPALRQAWRYLYDGRQPWVCGGTMLYRKDLWARVRFADTNVGEDNLFVWSPQPKRIAINPRNDLYVATVHRGNTSPKVVTNRRWRTFPAAQVEQLIRRGALAPAPAAAAAGL